MDPRFTRSRFKSLNTSISKGIEFLHRSQLPGGEFQTYFSPFKTIHKKRTDHHSPFVATFILYSLDFVGDPRVIEIQQKAVEFFLRIMEAPGIWSYEPSLDPDIDDTCCVAYAIKALRPDVSLDANVPAILKHRNEDGIFYTWMRDAGSANDIDSVVNANALLYLGENKETVKVCDYLNDVVLSGRENPSYHYYLDNLPLYYTISRAYRRGVTALHKCRDAVIQKTVSAYEDYGFFGSELYAALKLSTLLNLMYVDWHLFEEAIAQILKSQRTEGSWPAVAFFGGPGPPPNFSTWFGSEELTTGLCLEALGRYRELVNQDRHSVPLTQQEETAASPAGGRRTDLSDHFLITEPYLLEGLVSSEALAGVRKVARLLPSIDAGLECRLAADADQVDLSVLITPDHGLEIFAAQDGSFALPESLIANPVWMRIREFCRCWMEPQSLLKRNVDMLWLEFDLDDSAAKTPIPSVFVHLDGNNARTMKDEWDTLCRFVSILLPERLPSAQLERLSLCLSSLPDVARLQGIGALISRKTRYFRLAAGSFAGNALPSYLTQIGWPGKIGQLESFLHPFRDFQNEVDLFLDVADHVAPKIGIVFQRKSFYTDLPWQVLLERLVASSLCSPEKRDALLAWSGHCLPKQYPGLWPTDVLHAACFLDPDSQISLIRGVFRIKIVYETDGPTEAKAYLGLLRRLLQWDHGQWRIDHFT